MLDPRERLLFFDALRPPEGFCLDRAVFTTYSLDLITLVGLPMAFTSYGFKGVSDPRNADPLALLESIRGYSSRITVFVQAGQILESAALRRAQLLLGLMEESVVEAAAPGPGAFHPKVSVLRYVPDRDRDLREKAGLGNEVKYRVICSTRNLTFDSSWDTIFILDGIYREDRKKSYSRNHELVRFISSLPALALRKPMTEPRKKALDTLSSELAKVEFDLPEGFDDFGFCVFGLDEKPKFPFAGYSKTLSMSPFVTDGFLKRLTEGNGEHYLISRTETLDSLDDASLKAMKGVFYLSGDAEALSEQSVPEEDGGELGLQQGLHAKLFVADIGWNTRIWTGSANATDAAMRTNVEFMVTLTGKRSHCGVDVFLDGDPNGTGKSAKKRVLSFKDLLVPYKRLQPKSIDATKVELEASLKKIRSKIAAAGLVAVIESDGPEKERFRLKLLRGERPLQSESDSVRVRCRPISMPTTAGIPITFPLEECIADFGGLQFENLTSFIAFEAVASIKNRTRKSVFILNLPLRGVPEDRSDRILKSTLRNKLQFLRYIFMLIGEDIDERTQLTNNASPRHWDKISESTAGALDLPLLEPLLRTLDRHPAKIDLIGEIVDRLLKTPEGNQLLPEGFLDVWSIILEARRGVGRT